jgi:hypothetical protein
MGHEARLGLPRHAAIQGKRLRPHWMFLTQAVARDALALMHL